MKGKVSVELGDMPIPTDNHRGRKYRYPFPDLSIGKCFIVKGITSNMLSPYKAYAEKRLRRKYIIRTIERAKVACWRVA